MHLENDILHLRALEPEDLEILYKWENNSNLWQYGSTLSPYSKMIIRQYINDSLSSDIFQAKQLRLMIVLKDSNEVIGTIDLYELDVHHSRAGIGILIDDHYREKGYAKQTLKLIIDYAFNFLNLHQIFAHIADDNTHSLQLFSEVGFKKTSKLEKWLKVEGIYKDMYILQLFNEQKQL